MKKVIITLLSILILTNYSSQANGYVPLVREGVKWVEFFESYNDGYFSGIITFQFSGMTTIKMLNITICLLH